MTTLVLGTVGALVGNALLPGIGGNIGFLVGSLVGNLIDPPKIEGPRRSDLKLQRSEYGQMVPFVWGTGRIAGNVLDQTDLEEHEEKSGGKGGPEVTNYTYSASFLVALATAKRFGDVAILGILRVWADGRLIWDSDSGDDAPFTFYNGAETQTPDPTFEAIHGVGQQPAYRGMAYVVFADYMLTEFGDRIPALEFEVFTDAGVYPWRVATFTLAPDGFGIDSVTYRSGHVTVGSYDSGAGWYYEKTFSIDGVEDTGARFDAPLDYPASHFVPVVNLLAMASWDGWYTKNVFTTAFTANPFGGPVANSVYNSAVYKSNYIYATGYNALTAHVGIARWPATNGVISAETATADTFYDFGWANNQVSLFEVGTSSNEFVYVVDSYNTPMTLNEFSADLTLVRSWDLSAEYAIQAIVAGRTFTVYEQPLTGNLVFAVDRGNVGFKQLFCFILNDDLTLTQVDGIDSDPAGAPTMGPIIELGTSGYVTVGDGIANLNPPAAASMLATIVTDLSDMTGIDGAYDVTELTDDVRWYAIGVQTTVRNAIDPLRRGFFFDAVESDDLVKFRKRDATDSIATLDDDDLDAREYGTEPGTPLQTTRKREQGMPRNVTLRYIDVEMDYQTGVKQSPRLTTLSDSDVTLDLPIGFNANEALQKVWALQLSEWIEREAFSWSTTRKYAWVEPCDKVTVRGRVIRITTKNETPIGVIVWEGVLHRPSVYTQEQTAGSSEGFVPPVPIGAPVPTELVLLDIPVLSQNDSPFGFYAAMGPLFEGPWPGATLYKSVDGGVNYFSVAASNVSSIIGETSSSAAGSPTVSGVLSAYAGGDAVEEASICVVLSDVDSELISINATGLVNGENLCAISRGSAGSPSTLQWELLQFRDAALVAEKTYVLTGFLRGRKDTATSDHADGDQFIFLPVTNVDSPLQDLTQSYLYKAVTFGTTLAESTPYTFINTGVATDEFYEVEAGQLPAYPIVNPTAGSPLISYQASASDNGRLLVFQEAGGATLNLPQTLKAGWHCWVENVGPGDLVIGTNALIDGDGTDLTVISDDGLMLASDGSNYWTMRGIGSHGGVSGGGAPVDAQYLVLEGNAALTNERVVLAGPGITFTETGGSPGTGLTISATTSDAQFYVAEATGTLSNERVLSPGSNIEFSESGGSPPTGVTVNAVGLAPAAAPYYVAGTATGLDAARTLVAGSGITFTDGGGSPPTTTTISVASGTAPKVIQFACSNLTSALTPGTNKAVFRMPYAMTLTGVRASLYVADTGSPAGGITIDINEDGVSILSTKLTIDVGEKTSTTAATPAVISDASLADDAEITVDIDACGGNSKGLVVALIGS